LRLRRQRNAALATLQHDSPQSLAELTPAEVWQARLADEPLSAEQQHKLTMLHQQILEKLEHNR
jgi:DNA repair protein SbcD/Mre11